ncbi:hypothetical protein [Streptomyces sp. NPDC047841]|uniref:hypothetical protein n=1 Tax=Streptomyces sp. NPDC047841 TaxID=3154708 RepID=UPI003455E742
MDRQRGAARHGLVLRLLLRRAATLGSSSWVLNTYAIALAALLVVASRIGDRIGQRPVFLTGVTVFTLASFACALTPDLGPV